MIPLRFCGEASGGEGSSRSLTLPHRPAFSRVPKAEPPASSSAIAHPRTRCRCGDQDDPPPSLWRSLWRRGIVPIPHALTTPSVLALHKAKPPASPSASCSSAIRQCPRANPSRRRRALVLVMGAGLSSMQRLDERAWRGIQADVESKHMLVFVAQTCLEEE